jgi:hypothetical protein
LLGLGISKLIVGVLIILDFLSRTIEAGKLSFLVAIVGLFVGAAFNNAAAYDFNTGPSNFAGDLTSVIATLFSIRSGKSFKYRRS